MLIPNHNYFLMKTKFYQFLLASRILLILLPGISVAQVPTCGANVPFFQVDLTGHPDSIWISPNHSRVGNCCGTTSPDNCTSFEVLLDTGTAMINFNIASGAIPSGAMFYQINCGPPVPVGQPICIVGPGPHHITFCKPGNNQNTYMIQAIPKPTYPPIQIVRIGCHEEFDVLGLTSSSVTWTSVYPGAIGQYDSYLSCTSGCTNPQYTPAPNAPAYIIYKICGTPIANVCGYNATCDTFRVNNLQPLTATVTPIPAQFCVGGGGVTLTASAGGGMGPYSYIWKDPGNTIVSTSATCLATTAGSYTLEVRDALYSSSDCPALFQTIPVTAVPPPVVSAGADQLVCHDQATVNLSGTVVNGSGGVWSGGAGTFSPSNTSLNTSYTATSAEIAAGSVTLTLTSSGAGGGCSNTSDQVLIHFAPSLSINLPNVTLACNNASTILSPIVSGNTGSLHYSWSNGSTASTVQVSNGSFCVTITDSLGCSANACATVTAPQPLTITTHTIDCPVPGSGVATVSVSVSGGWQSNYQVSFNNGVTYQASGNYSASLPVGATYTVWVKDSNNCASPLAYTLSINPEVSVTAIDFSKCYYGVVSASQVTVTPSGGCGGTYWISLDGGATYQNAGNYVLTVPINSTYNIVVKDSNGCVSTTSGAINLPDVLASTGTVSIYNGYNISCNGMTDGGIQLNTTGGTSPYTYTWNNSGTTANQTGLSAGAYSVIVTDANNCQDTLSFTLNEPIDLSTAISATSNYNGYEISCNGSSDANINLTVSGGVTAYTYQWSTGAATEDISGVAAGTYSVIVTDANNCKDTAQVTITEPPALTSTISITSNYNGYGISCAGSSNGSLNVQVTGGVTAYSYFWSNGATTANQSNLGAGTYSVIVSDANNCQDTLSATITQPTPLASTVSVTTSFNGSGVSCNGSTDAAIDLEVTGGVPAYSFQWSNGASTQDLSGVGAGTYSVIITDANNCQDTASVNVNEPTAITATLTVGSNYNGYGISCFGSTDGSLNLSVNGGTPAYTYSWSNGSPSPNLSSVGAGTYTVTVTDQNGCSSTISAVLTQPAALASSIVSVSAYNGYGVSCASSTNGSIGIQVSGGVTAYSYNWSNGSTAANQSNLGAGTYSVIITDANNCKDTLQATLTEPAPLASTINVITNFNGYGVSCNGSNDAGIDLSVNGGVMAYSYQWSNSATSQDLSGVGAGTYSVIITDANNCQDTASISVNEPPALTATLTLGSNYNGYGISCFGSTDGSLSLQVGGGTPAYSYSWSNGSTSPNLSSIGAGTYTVTFTDQNGCSNSLSAVVSQPAALSSSIVSLSNYNGYNISCPGQTDGSIGIQVTGGVAAYSYNWSNGATGASDANIGAGTYSVIITDANNCKDTLQATLTEPPAISASATISDHNGFSVSCFGGYDGSIQTSVNGGVTPYTFAWSNGSSAQSPSILTAGSYSVLITDLNGCTTSLSFHLTQPNSVTSQGTVQNVLCNGFTNGSVHEIVDGGVAPYTFNWSNGATTQDLNNIGAGTYWLVITDANNCAFSYAYNVTENSPVKLLVNSNNVSCYGLTDGNISSQVSGGTPGYAYQWSNGSTQTNLNNLGAGTYVLTVTDVNNCTSTETVTISAPVLLDGSLNSPLTQYGFNESSPTASDGSITSSVSGGTAPYMYNWSNGANTPDLTNVPAGTYTLTVTDQHGCKLTESIVLTAPLELAMPSGISPNGDGLNDFFVVHGLELYPSNNLKIFNRWGNSVYEKDNYMQSWSGKTNSGADLPDGTYFVILKINNSNITLTGYVDVRR